MIDRPELIQRDCEMVLDALNRPGSQNEVAAMHDTKLRLVYEGNDYSVAAETSSDISGIRTIEDGRLGFIATNGSGEVLRTSARDCIALARLSPPSEFHAIAPAAPHNGSHYFIDDSLRSISAADGVRLLSILIDAARGDKRVTIDRAEIAFNLVLNCVMNSNGVRASWGLTSAEWFIMGMARDGSQVTSFDYDGGTHRTLAGLELELANCGGEFRKNVISSLDPLGGSSYKGPVLLHPRAVCELFGGVIFTNCNARMHQEKTSAWTDRFGELVAHSGLTVAEEPQNPDRPEGWMPFDREGVPTSSHNLIENGRLSFLAHNCFTSRRGGTAPTGNATGSPRSIPGIGFGNTSFKATAPIKLLDDKALTKHSGRTLMLVRFSGNDDPMSGEFSGVAKNSYWLEDGARQPAGEVMISGNLFDMIQSPLAAGLETHRVLGGSTAPYILVDGMSITAGN